MTSSQSKKITWSHVKQEASNLDHAALINLVGELYQASTANQLFLNARFGLGGDVLEPYKAIIDRWVCPDIERNQDISIPKARKVITNYRRAVGDPAGIADLGLYYCEACADFLSFCGVENEDYYDAIIDVAEVTLDAVAKLNPQDQTSFLARMEIVWAQSIDWGWGVSDEIGEMMSEQGFDRE